MLRHSRGRARVLSGRLVDQATPSTRMASPSEAASRSGTIFWCCGNSYHAWAAAISGDSITTVRPSNPRSQSPRGGRHPSPGAHSRPHRLRPRRSSQGQSSACCAPLQRSTSVSPAGAPYEFSGSASDSQPRTPCWFAHDHDSTCARGSCSVSLAYGSANLLPDRRRLLIKVA